MLGTMRGTHDSHFTVETLLLHAVNRGGRSSLKHHSSVWKGTCSRYNYSHDSLNTVDSMNRDLMRTAGNPPATLQLPHERLVSLPYPRDYMHTSVDEELFSLILCYYVPTRKVAAELVCYKRVATHRGGNLKSPEADATSGSVRSLICHLTHLSPCKTSCCVRTGSDPG